MKRNEKLLAGGLVAVLVLWQGSNLIQSWYFQPITDREQRLEGLQKQVGEKELKQRELEITSKRLDEYRRRSLPSDRVVAATVYQNWLIDEAGRAKLKNVSVTGNKGDARVIGNTYITIPAELKAEGTLAQLCDFLHAFHQSGLLHRVKSISLEASRHTGDPNLNLVVNVEGLALQGLEPRSTLFADPEKHPSPEKPLRDREQYVAITKRNVFVKGYNGPPEPPRESRPKPKSPAEEAPDVAEFVYVVAIVAEGPEQLEAWLYDRTANQRTILTRGGDFKVAGIEGKVVAIQRLHVVVEIKGEQWQLDIGENLRQMHKVEPSA